jgi:hypothetical protein
VTKRWLIVSLLFCAGPVSIIVLGQSPAIRVSDWSAAVPGVIACGSTPQITVNGPGDLFLPANRAALEQLLTELSAAIRQPCPALNEVVLVQGRTRRLSPLPSAVVATSPSSSPASIPSQAPRLFLARDIGRLENARRIEDKCALLLQWLGRIQTEFPGKVLSRAVDDDALAVFHDSDFVPVFGRTFDTATSEWKIALHRDIISRCQETAAFEMFRPLLDGGFLGRGIYGTSEITASIEAARHAEKWLQESLALLYELGATDDALAELQLVSPEATWALGSLWPTQRSEYAAAVSERSKAVAGELTDQWMRKLAATGGGRPEATALAEERSKRFVTTKLASEQKQSAEAEAFVARIEALLAPEVSARVSALEKVPATLVGARQFVNWKDSLEKDIAPLSNAVVSRTLRTAQAQRQRILEGAFPEWQKLIAEGATSIQSRKPLAEALDAIFPASMRVGDSYFQKYSTALADGMHDVEQRVFTAALAPCDAFAAHPDDPEGPGKGLRDGQLNPTDVIAACEDAVLSEEAEPRHFFQLARGYLMASRSEDAVDYLMRAAEQGHGASLAYLADLQLDGVAGLDADPALAYDLYERAAEAGFAPATKILKEFEDYAAKFQEAEDLEREETAIADAEFTQPDIVEHTMAGDFDEIKAGEMHVKIHLANMADTIREECSAHFTSGDVDRFKMNAVMKSVDVSPAGGAAVLMNILTDLVQMTRDPVSFITRAAQSRDADDVALEGMKDGFALMSVHPCKSPGLTQFARNVREFFDAPDAPSFSAADMTRVCQANAQPTGRYDARNFCTCFVPAVMTHPATRSQRKRLMNDFWPAAQEIMAEDPQRFSLCVNGPGR